MYQHVEHAHRHHDNYFRHFLLHYHNPNFNPHNCGFVYHVQCSIEPHRKFVPIFEPYVERFVEPLVVPYQIFEPLDEPFLDFEPFGVVPLDDFEPPVNFEPIFEPFFEPMADFEPFFEPIKNFEPF